MNTGKAQSQNANSLSFPRQFIRCVQENDTQTISIRSKTKRKQNREALKRHGEGQKKNQETLTSLVYYIHC